MTPRRSLLATQPDVAILGGEKDGEIAYAERRGGRFSERFEAQPVINLETPGFLWLVRLEALDTESTIPHQAERAQCSLRPLGCNRCKGAQVGTEFEALVARVD